MQMNLIEQMIQQRADDCMQMQAEFEQSVDQLNARIADQQTKLREMDEEIKRLKKIKKSHAKLENR